MAMYYYASKISAVAFCGTRCKQNTLHKTQNHERENHCCLAKSPEEVITNKISEMNSTVDNTKDVNYSNRNIVSGSLDSLIELLMPYKAEQVNEEYIFSFILSSRLYIRQDELLGKLLSFTMPEKILLDRIVQLLGIWTETIPYDFRDERIMCHIKHLVSRCADTEIGDVVSELLSALLTRLTDLKSHEEDLNASQLVSAEINIIWPSSSDIAKLLRTIELKLAKHVGPEEFLQCSTFILFDRKKNKDDSTDLIEMGQKRTCNLEGYLDWSNRLRLLVSNEILKSETQERNEMFELWSHVGYDCILMGNYNSAYTILESLLSTPIARLQNSGKTSSTFYQVKKLVEDFTYLWTQQTSKNLYETKNFIKEKQQLNWVEIPIFAKIVESALNERKNCLKRLPYEHLNVSAFNNLANIVGCYTKHIASLDTLLDSVDYEWLFRKVQGSPLVTNADQMLSSFNCEEPTKTERDAYDIR